MLVWILADPNLLYKRVIHQKATWGRRCDKLLVFSSKEDKDFPAIGLPGTQNGRSHIDHKAKAAWKYVYENYGNDYDFFLKVDSDTYVIVENLLDFLSDKDPSKPDYFGHWYKPPESAYPWPAGGSGEVLTKETLRLLVTKAFLERSRECWPDGEGANSCLFFQVFWADIFICPTSGPLIPLFFFISGDVSSGFQSQSGFCLTHVAEANGMYIP